MPEKINRRLFTQSAATGMLSLAGIQSLSAETGHSDNNFNKSIQEPVREVPIVHDCDVLVCGSGPAGVSAALSAARSGAKTALIEMHGCLGGTWTAGLLSWILDSKNKPGIIEEIKTKLKRRGGAKYYNNGHSIGYDVEAMKALLEELCIKENIKIQLHTQAVAAICNDEKRLKYVITESKSGRQAWQAKMVIDATGDGDIAARAGCGFDYGREGDGAAQPMSLIALVIGLNKQDATQFVRCLAEPAGFDDPKTRFRTELQRAGINPSYSRPTLFCIHDDLYAMMANHEYGVCAFDAREITEATIRARDELHRMINGLRSLGGVWKNIRLVATGEQIGVREGRRIHGLYTVTKEDLIKGARFEDGVCRVHFGVDVHAPKKHKGTGGIDRTGVRSKPYDIPLRSLIAKDVKGLMMAGRCISGDFIAHSSYRVTGDAAMLGQAAGVTAALAAEREQLPQELPWSDVNAAIEKL